jgi:site-specific recombinase XerD
MVIDSLLRSSSQARGVPDTDPLLRQKSDFDKYYRTYMVILHAERKESVTISRYGMILRMFQKFLMDNDLTQNVKEISSLEVGLFLQQAAARGLAPDTLYGYHKDLRIFFNWLIREEILTKNPLSKIASPRRTIDIIKPLSHDDIVNILLLCSGKLFTDIRNRAIMMTFLDTGLRLKELASITTDNLDIQNGLIQVMGKGRKKRFVRIGHNAQRAILKYMLVRNDTIPEFWQNEHEKPILPGGIKIMVKRLLASAHVSSSKQGCHILRHTFAINFLRNGGSLAALQVMLGHSDITTTMLYLRSLGSDDMIREHLKASPMDNLK